ncbi:phosphate ABC transporter substrate-binding protein [Ligilactobacillus salitolerans]|uniref:Phosphate-binding protein n=1 Tax=Ligilactobacillus salitolerans TaxID=1808352 RepID=A0A401IRW4_9LACO|nr:phosphate ABC transporter substrate-binding protein [Ligilactobacillus salitolerans]GBG94244.1 phosphate ABC transporter substrate-binding protein [Ligilactobacillus salitolerans]
MKFGKRIAMALTVVGLSGIFLAACGSNSKDSSSSSNDASGKVTAVGSTALQPLVEKASSQFKTDNPKANLTVQGGGSGTGLSQVQSGAVQIGNSDIFAEQQEGIHPDKLVDHKVAVVGMAPVVNKDVGVKNVTMDQLRQIFTGKITNWKQLGGKNEKISVINRAKGSGTRATFENAVLQQDDKPVEAQEQDSNGTVQKVVAQTPGSISYLAFAYVNKDLQELSIDHVQPNYKNVSTNKWKIWSYEHMYTKGQPKGLTKKFINYVLSDSVQKSLVSKLGYYSINGMKVKMGSDGQVESK